METVPTTSPGEQHTVPLRLVPDLSTVTRYERPPARLPRALRRIARSKALRDSVQAAYWPALICSCLVIGVFVGVATRGQFVDWSGFHPIPTGGAR